ncbi:MAG: AAA family ATPase [Muribaculaceae bacterium]|nr:AAA family ATPase [Muribaculaceae bacterium]
MVFLYVDKTEYIEKIIKGSKYYFLGRSRRFGKSLFLSNLKSFINVYMKWIRIFSVLVQSTF